jgi:hypothetical protein
VQSYFAATPPWIQSLPLFGARSSALDRVVEVKGNVRALLEPFTTDREQVMIAAARALADSLVAVLLSPNVATGESASSSTTRRTAASGPLMEQALDAAAGAIRAVA